MRIWDKIKDFFGIVPKWDDGPDDWDDEDGIIRDEVEVPDLLRNTLYDTGFPHVEEVMGLLGYHGQSDDVSEMSLMDSAERVQALAGIYPIITLLTDAVHTGLSAYMREQLGDDAEFEGMSLDDSFIDSAFDTQGRIITASTVAVIANLVDMGYLHVDNVQVVGMHVVETSLPWEEEEEDE